MMGERAQIDNDSLLALRLFIFTIRVCANVPEFSSPFASLHCTFGVICFPLLESLSNMCSCFTLAPTGPLSLRCFEFACLELVVDVDVILRLLLLL